MQLNLVRHKQWSYQISVNQWKKQLSVLQCRFISIRFIRVGLNHLPHVPSESERHSWPTVKEKTWLKAYFPSFPTSSSIAATGLHSGSALTAYSQFIEMCLRRSFICNRYMTVSWIQAPHTHTTLIITTKLSPKPNTHWTIYCISYCIYKTK